MLGQQSPKVVVDIRPGAKPRWLDSLLLSISAHQSKGKSGKAHHHRATGGEA
jgi:hypothetical protein